MNKIQYDAQKAWNEIYTNKSMAYPSEYVIRILKGSFPNLNLNKSNFKNSKFCDLGCGDGRNLFLAKECGFDIFGMEISEKIVHRVKSNLENSGIFEHEIKVGKNESIPFDNNMFDYVLSWNACYYMGKNEFFEKHVHEFSRILKKDSYLILSIPQKTCFIYKNSIQHKPGYNIIKDDYFNLRNGEILRIFEDEREIEQTFGGAFKNFVFGSIQDNCFGLNYHWHLIVCQKK